MSIASASVFPIDHIPQLRARIAAVLLKPISWKKASAESGVPDVWENLLCRGCSPNRCRGFTISHRQGQRSRRTCAPTNKSSGYRSDTYPPKDASQQGSVATFNRGSKSRASDYSAMDGASRLSKRKSGPIKISYSHRLLPKPKRAFSYNKENVKDIYGIQITLSA